MRSIAIITARGGSKRIPGKNIREFCGKPILAYSIEAAIKSGIFDEVMVSTDSEEISEVAKKYGAHVPFLRSEEASGDYATTQLVLTEVLAKYHEIGRDFDCMVCIYPTAPFITPQKLKNAVEILKANSCTMVVPVVKFSFQPQRAYVINNGMLEFKWKQYAFARSQDLEPFYHDAGQFYVYDIKNYLHCDRVASERVMPYELPAIDVQDIDNEDDWAMAEMKFRLMKESGK